MPLSLLYHSALSLFAQRTRIPTCSRSIGFCAIWVCISSSSSSFYTILVHFFLFFILLVSCIAVHSLASSFFNRSLYLQPQLVSSGGGIGSSYIAPISTSLLTWFLSQLAPPNLSSQVQTTQVSLVNHRQGTIFILWQFPSCGLQERRCCECTRRASNLKWVNIG